MPEPRRSITRNAPCHTPQSRRSSWRRARARRDEHGDEIAIGLQVLPRLPPSGM